MNSPRRFVSVVGSAAVALAVLAGCSSEPSARRVALDIIDSVEGLSDVQRDCMRDRLATYTNDELKQIAEDNADVDFANATEGATEGWQKFESDLAECMTAERVAETEGTAVEGSEPAGGEPVGSAPAESAPAATLG